MKTEQPKDTQTSSICSEEETLVTCASGASNEVVSCKSDFSPTAISHELRDEPSQACRILLRYMRQYPKDETLHVKALVSLVRMTASDEQREVVGESACLQAVIDTMRSFSANEHILCKGCMVLANAAFHSEANKKIVNEHGGIQLLVEALEKNEGKEQLVSLACLALRNLTSESLLNQKEACAQGVATRFTAIMQRYLWNHKILTHVVCSIGHISSGDLQCQHMLREAKCMHELLVLMRKHLSQPVLVEHSTVAIANLCNRNEINQGLFTKLNGVYLLADAFKCHKDNAHLYTRFYGVVKSLCLDEEAWKQTADFGILIGIIENMNFVSKEQGAQGVIIALQALHSVIAGSEQNRNIISRSGGIETIMKHLELCSENVDVLDVGFQVFCSLGDRCGTTSHLLGASKVYLFLLNRMQKFCENEQLVEHCFKMFYDVSADRFDEELVGIPPVDILLAVNDCMKKLPVHGRAHSVGKKLLPLLEEQARLRDETTVKKKGSFHVIMHKVSKTFSMSK